MTLPFNNVLGGRTWQNPVAIGGNVVALLIKAKKRKAQAMPLGSSYVQPLYDYISIPIHVKTQESYTYKAEITQYPVESGVMVSDHAIVHPIRVDLAFETSNLPGMVPGPFVQGTALAPLSGVDIGKRALELFLLQLESRQPVTLVTQHLALDNMVCDSVQATNDAPLWGKLSFRASFQQVMQVTLQDVTISRANVEITEKQTAVEGRVAGSDDKSITPAVTKVKKQKVKIESVTNTAKDVITRQKALGEAIYGAKVW